jgi:hypothetical protein
MLHLYCRKKNVPYIKMDKKIAKTVLNKLKILQLVKMILDVFIKIKILLC